MQFLSRKRNKPNQNLLEDALVIGYDSGKSRQGIEYDRPCLIVGRKTEDGLNVLNQIMDDEATEIYEKLVTSR